jgi:hypothetical protein
LKKHILPDDVFGVQSRLLKNINTNEYWMLLVDMLVVRLLIRLTSKYEQGEQGIENL